MTEEKKPMPRSWTPDCYVAVLILVTSSPARQAAAAKSPWAWSTLESRSYSIDM